MIARLFGRRSIHVPAAAPSIAGSQVAAVKALTWKVEACSSAIAMSGRASRLTWSPSSEIDWPVQNSMKPRLRRSGAGAGTAGAGTAGTAAT